MTSPVSATINTAASTREDQPAIIATRQHCEADGVGLSHYILMDRAANPAETSAAIPAAAPAATA